MTKEASQMIRYPLTVLFDGACPLCSREMGMIKRLDKKRRLRFCDFAGPAYDREAMGILLPELSAVLHAQWADGTVIKGVEVFRAIWQAVGLGVLTRLSRLPIIDSLVVKGYGWFAKNRLRLTGRTICSVDQCRSDPVINATHPPA